MTKKTITDFFKNDLKAPLHNTIWSWGAVSSDGKRQTLRVWADEYKKIDGSWWVAVDHVDIPADKKSPGAPERRRHVEALRASMPTAGVIVTAVDPDAKPREIRHYDDNELLEISSEFRVIGNDLYTREVRKIKPSEFRCLE